MKGGSKKLADLLPKFLQTLSQTQKLRPDLIVAGWPEVVGEKLAPMTEALSFEKGVLYVKVKNATLHSLLAQYEKAKLVEKLKERFPEAGIRNIVFRVG
jgi:hypothetical protein